MLRPTREPSRFRPGTCCVYACVDAPLIVACGGHVARVQPLVRVRGSPRSPGRTGASRRTTAALAPGSPRACTLRVLSACEGTLKGNKAHGRIGHRSAGNGSTMIRTRRWRKASKPTRRESAGTGDSAGTVATARRPVSASAADGAGCVGIRFGESEPIRVGGAPDLASAVSGMRSERQGGNGCGDAVRLQTSGILRRVRNASRELRRSNGSASAE